MDRLNKFEFILIFSLGFLGCGVKGSPLPPLNPASLGRGESSFKEASEKKTLKKSNSKNLKNEEKSLGESVE